MIIRFDNNENNNLIIRMGFDNPFMLISNPMKKQQTLEE